MRSRRKTTKVPAVVSAEVPALVAIDGDHQLPTAKHPTHVYLETRGSDDSRRAVVGALKVAARILLHLEADAEVDIYTVPFWRIGFQHMEYIRAEVTKREYAPSTLKLVLVSLRRVKDRARRLKLISHQEYLESTDLDPVKVPPAPPAGRDLSERELSVLFDAIAGQPEPIRQRDLCLAALLVGCGLRRAEAVTLDVKDYDRANGKLTVRGKGGVKREVYCRNEVQDAVEDWLQVRGDRDGRLLLEVTRHGTIRYEKHDDQGEPRGISATAAYKRIVRFVKASPHDLRRTFVGRLLDAGADLPAVQRACGHKSPQTTSNYDRRAGRALENAARLVRLPVRGGR